MEISLFLAEFWGWYLIIFFLILSFNPIRIKQIFADLRDQKFLILAAFMAILLGLLTVLLHNIWEPDWRLLITLIGWGSLSLGLTLFIFPKPTIDLLEVINIRLVQTLYVLLFLGGMYLISVAYSIVLY